MAELPRRSQVAAADPARFDRLSAREREVISLAAAGYVDKQIGSQLGVSLNTLRTYWSRIREKVGVLPRTALAAAYVEQALVQSRGAAPEDDFWDWEIDLRRRTMRRLSSREIPSPLLPRQEGNLDRLMADIHPEDEPRVRRLFEELRHNQVEAFHIVARIIMPEGMMIISSFVHVHRDAKGMPERLTGRRVLTQDVRAPQTSPVRIGYWTRNLRTGDVWLSDACCEIFEVDPESPTLFEDFHRRIEINHIEDAKTFTRDALKLGLSHRRRTFRLRFEDGRMLWTAWDLKIESDDAGPAKSAVTVMAFE